LIPDYFPGTHIRLAQLPRIRTARDKNLSHHRIGGKTTLTDSSATDKSARYLNYLLPNVTLAGKQILINRQYEAVE